MCAWPSWPRSLCWPCAWGSVLPAPRLPFGATTSCDLGGFASASKTTRWRSSTRCSAAIPSLIIRLDSGWPGAHEVDMRTLLVGAAIVGSLLQSPSPQLGAQKPGGPPPPARDNPADKKGTAVIRGKIVAADTERALRRARVTVSSAELGPNTSKSTSTDLSGRFE